MPTGKVKWFNSKKGYGFITEDGTEKDIFLHVSALEESKLKTLDRYNSSLRNKPLDLDQVKSFIEELNKKNSSILYQGKFKEGGRVSEQSPLGRIFNRFYNIQKMLLLFI